MYLNIANGDRARKRNKTARRSAKRKAKKQAKADEVQAND